MNKNIKFLPIFVVFALMLTIVFFSFSKLTEAKSTFGLDQKIKQVKVKGNSAVYYLDHNLGKKKAYVNEASYLAYGNKWSDVKVISQAELDKWPNIELVKSSDSPKIYYITGINKAYISSPSQLRGLGFSFADVITIKRQDLDQYKEVSIDEAVAKNKPQNVTNSEIFVSLPAQGVTSNILPLNTANNFLATFNFQANAYTEIKSLSFKLNGVFNTSTLGDLYLTNEAGNPYNVRYSLDGRKAIFNFTTPLVVHPTSSLTIKVFANFNDCANCTNHMIGVSLDSPSDINSSAKISGTFPVKGTDFKLVQAQSVLGQPKIKKESSAVTEAIIGTSDQIIGKFYISELSGKDNLVIKTLTFKNNGSARKGDLTTFKLKNEKGQIVAQSAALSSDNLIIFNPTNLKISKNSSGYFYVLASIVSGEGGSINLELKDAIIYGDEQKFGLRATYEHTQENILIKRRTLEVKSLELKASNSVFSKQSGVIIGNFEIKSNLGSINLESIDFLLESGSATPALNGAGYLVDYNTGEVLNSFNAESWRSGKLNIDLSNKSIASKGALSLAVIANVPSAAKAGDYYQVSLDSIYYHAANNSYYEDKLSVAGVKLYVNRSSLYAYNHADSGNISYIKGQLGVAIGKFYLEASSEDDVVITRLEVQKTNNSGAISYATGFSNIRAYIGSSKSSNIISQPTDGPMTFEGFKYQLKKGTKVEVKIYADLSRDLTISRSELAISNISATSYTSGLLAGINNLAETSFQVEYGNATADVELISGGNIIAGEKENLVAAFKIKNTGDDELKLSSVLLSCDSAGLTSSLGYSNLRIKEDESQKQLGSVSSPVSGSNKISLGSYRIKPNEEKTFNIYVDAKAETEPGSFNMYLREFAGTGYISKIAFKFLGDPTQSVKIVVN